MLTRRRFLQLSLAAAGGACVSRRTGNEVVAPGIIAPLDELLRRVAPALAVLVQQEDEPIETPRREWRSTWTIDDLARLGRLGVEPSRGVLRGVQGPIASQGCAGPYDLSPFLAACDLARAGDRWGAERMAAMTLHQCRAMSHREWQNDAAGVLLHFVPRPYDDSHPPTFAHYARLLREGARPGTPLSLAAELLEMELGHPTHAPETHRFLAAAPPTVPRAGQDEGDRDEDIPLSITFKWLLSLPAATRLLDAPAARRWLEWSIPDPGLAARAWVQLRHLCPKAETWLDDGERLATRWHFTLSWLSPLAPSFARQSSSES